MCLDSNGMYPHPTDCQAFYKCTEGVPVLSFCVGDEHFNPRDHLCQDPCLALCDNTIDCSGMTQSPSSVTTEEFSISGNINTTLMTDGTSYRTTETNDFTNDSSTPSDNEVSSTSIVSEVTSVEDNSTETEISTLPTSPETFTSFRTTLSDISSTRSSEETNNSPISVFSTTTTGPSNFMSTTVYDIDRTEWPICQDPNGLYPNPNDCRSFFMCIGGEPYETQCDEQLHFSPLTQRCEFPCIAKCDPTLDCSSTHPPIATSAVPFIKCPQKDFFPVFEQCDYYFDCVGTFPRIQSCPVGLTFNATTRVCDWPENAECGSSVKPLPESDDGYDCPCETCLVPSMSNCKDYYLCFNYKAYPMECSNGLLFDQSLNTCNYQSKTLCNIASSTTITTTSTTTTTALPSSTTQSYKCPERNGMFRDPSNCRRFIHCSNYWPYTKDCPGGLHFSVELQRCEWPCEAKCDLTLPCVAAQQTPTPLRLPSTTPDPLCPCKNCRVSNPESCTKYVECTNGISKRKNCPRGQTFDHQRQRCDWAHKVDCPYSQICPRSNGLFLYKDDCHKFVHCSNGIPYIKTCPSGLEFDPRTLRCEWPSGKCVSAKPELSSRAEEIDEQLLQEEIDEELFQEKWTCPEKFGYFPHETSCSKFYQCSFGTPHLKECSDDLSYNPLYQTCDWQKNVKCGSHQQHYRRRCRRYDRQILCPQNKTHVAHPHCDMFYDCSTGSPCPKRCPNGLFFNSITHMCDTAENVNCLKRDGEVYSLKNMAEACHRKGKGQMQDPANDSCFYKCHNHKVIRGCCSRNRIFNEKSNNCMLKTFIPPNLRIFG
ncbi:putative chitinase 3, partial [Stegodyphus mimosarum]